MKEGATAAGHAPLEKTEADEPPHGLKRTKPASRKTGDKQETAGKSGRKNTKTGSKRRKNLRTPAGTTERFSM